MNCQICNRPSEDKYCNNCKGLRSVYVIHKLYEKISLNEKFNRDTLKIKNLKNIEEYDLELLTENQILIKDRFNNYKWTNIEEINNYLSIHDRTGKQLTIKEKTRKDNKKKSKEDKKITISEAILVLEKNYNITETFDEEELSNKLKTNKKQTKDIIKKLTDVKLIKKSFYGRYRLNYQEILKFKEKNNIKEKKINKLSNIKQSTNENKTRKGNEKQSKTKKKTSKKKSNKNKSRKKQNNTKKEEIDKSQLSQEEKTIPLIREYINNCLIILPRNVKENDLTLNELYKQYQEHTKSDITRNDFDKYFHRTINTYPHIRHQKSDENIKYNIKSRKTPQIIINNLQENTQKFTFNDKSIVQLKQNTLKVDATITTDELPQLYSLLVYTQENIIKYNYDKKDEEIHIEITYDLNDENPDLWIKFLKSYNIG